MSLAAGSAFGSTNVLFSADPQSSVSTGPFPSNAVTTADPSQLTGLRINLPAAANSCDSTSLSVCGNTSALNQLDGFSVNPRLMVCFSGTVNQNTLQAGITLQPVNGGPAIGINQIEYDAAANCAFAKPDAVLNQQSAYLLVVTSAVTDLSGNPVGADSGFEGCLQGGTPYCSALEGAAQKAGILGNTNGANTNGPSVVGGSLFTTLSATHWLEQVRKAIDAVPLITNLPAGFPNSFSLKSVQSINWYPAQSGLAAQPIPLTSLSGVDSIAFGLYLSPNYISTSGATAGTIPQTPTALPAAPPAGVSLVSYHVFLPPAKGSHKIPVVIYGHGLSDSQFGAPTYIASKLAQNGFATLAIEVMGHGYGAGSYVTVTNTAGQNFYEWTPGRGVQLGAGNIGATDGCIAPGAVAVRDCARQTAVDLFALVDTIRSTNGLGLNLDPNAVYYVGQSFGSTAGTLFEATEPSVHTAVLNVDGGSSVDVARLAVSGEPLDVAYILSENPALFNGTNCLAPPTSVYNCFNTTYPFRNQITSPAVTTVPIEAAFEAADWLGMPGDPLAFAPHLQSSAYLSGVTQKATLFQFGYGDLEVPNPTESELVRTAGGVSTTTFLHFDLAVQKDPSLAAIGVDQIGFPILPHRILSNPTLPMSASEASIAGALQQQVADFFASNGATVSNPNIYLTGTFSGVHLFDGFGSPADLPNGLDYPPPTAP